MLMMRHPGPPRCPVPVVVKNPKHKDWVSTEQYLYEPASELTSMGTDNENTEASVRNAIRDQPHESHIPSIEGSEPPTDLEHTIKKKSKGKANVRKYIKELKEGDEEEDSSPQESPVIVRTKRFRTETVRTLPDSWPWQLD